MNIPFDPASSFASLIKSRLKSISLLMNPPPRIFRFPTNFYAKLAPSQHPLNGFQHVWIAETLARRPRARLCALLKSSNLFPSFLPFQPTTAISLRGRILSPLPPQRESRWLKFSNYACVRFALLEIIREALDRATTA